MSWHDLGEASGRVADDEPMAGMTNGGAGWAWRLSASGTTTNAPASTRRRCVSSASVPASELDRMLAAAVRAG
jgi:hypothetical protein